MYNKEDIENIILKMAEIVKENRSLKAENICLKDEKMERLWYEFQTKIDVNEKEEICSNWNGFKKGTKVDKIFEYFDNEHSKGTNWLLNNIDIWAL